MKNPLLVILVLLQVHVTFAQDKTYVHPTTGQFFLSGSQFRTPSRTLKFYPGFGFNFTKGLQPKLDWGATINFTMADSVMKYKEGFNSNQPLITLDFGLRYRFLPPSQLVQPYISGGLGVSAFKSYLGQYIVIGTGMQVKALENVSFLSLDKVSVVVNIQRKLRLSNTLSNHNFFTIGLAGNIGKLIKERPVPVIELNPMTVNIDRDQDGIVDSLDFCPDIAGLTAYQGCPDTDQDGVSDNHDKCPTTVGLEKYHGCPIPDSDGDELNDEVDSCPTVAGLLKYHGCPIPDSDGDGINDEEDSCVNEMGLVEMHGCPHVTEEVKAAVDLAAKNIFFKLGSFELLPASHVALDEVAKILSENPNLLLDIEGHSDAVGSTKTNKQLSAKRASSIFEYLVSKGIEPTRILTIGYGSERPIADNATEEGRAQNRRVELKLKAKEGL